MERLSNYFGHVPEHVQLGSLQCRTHQCSAHLRQLTGKLQSDRHAEVSNQVLAATTMYKIRTPLTVYSFRLLPFPYPPWLQYPQLNLSAMSLRHIFTVILLAVLVQGMQIIPVLLVWMHFES